MTEEAPFNPNRQLCPDGTCVGLLGPDGLCSVCGHPQAASAQDDADDADGAIQTGGPSGFDAARRLCDDGSCVGVVGAEGVCGTCGRKAG
jgi:hypothetical protein